MKRYRVEPQVRHFIDFLTGIAGRFAGPGEEEKTAGKAYLEAIRGLWSEWPEGFLAYLRTLVLQPLDKLGSRGIYEKEYLALRKILQHWHADIVPHVTDNRDVTELRQALAPLVADFQRLVTPAEPAVSHAAGLDEDEVSDVFDRVWQDKWQHHFCERRGSQRLQDYKDRFAETLAKKQGSTGLLLRQSREQLSVQMNKHLPQFMCVLQAAAAQFYRCRTKAVLTRSITEVVDAYHIFFQSMEYQLINWLGIHFGRGGDSAKNYATFFCMIKAHINVNVLLSTISKMELQLSQSQLYFLRLIKDELAAVAHKTQNDQWADYSLFKSCYAMLFTAVTESARTLYQQHQVRRADELVDSVKNEKLGEKRFKEIKRISFIQKQLVAQFAFGRLVAVVPEFFRPLVLWVKRIWLRLMMRFNPALRDINTRRVHYVNQQAERVKDVLYKDPNVNIPDLTFGFRNALIAANSPLMEHRLTVFSKTQPRAVRAVDSVYQSSVTVA